VVDLVLGAGGFVGLRLVKALAAAGRPVRGFVRGEAAAGTVQRLGGVPARGDLLTGEGVAEAFRDARCVYYLVHSLRGGPGFPERDARAGAHAVAAAREAGAARIVYAGGLGAREGAFSLHLRSRYGVEEQIRGSGVPFTVLRAGAVLGRGGASFEVMRHVVLNMPVVPMLAWRHTRMQPIGADDLVRYLVMAPGLEEAAGRTFDVGCEEVVTYEDMLVLIAELLHVRLRAVRLPGFWPRASALALRGFSTVPPPIVAGLVPGLRESMICNDRSADLVFGFRPLPLREAVAAALAEYE
jgi:uncharacterized protein YbjT (DUF2867 family)